MNEIPPGTRVRSRVTIRGEERGYGLPDAPIGSVGTVHGSRDLPNGWQHVDVALEGENGALTSYYRTELETV